MNYLVKRITRKESLPFILNLHYAQRIPIISYAYGLFNEEELIGVCTIGKPASNSLCSGICGEEFKSKVYELNRLVLVEGLERNTASFFVGAVLRDLREEDLIIVSYADEAMNHYGYVYQATNFIYTGKTDVRTDKYISSGKHSRHADDSIPYLRRVRSSKHRYVYFTGKSKRFLLKRMNYPILSFPKGNSERYVLGERKKEKIWDKRKDEIYYE